MSGAPIPFLRFLETLHVHRRFRRLAPRAARHQRTDPRLRARLAGKALAEGATGGMATECPEIPVVVGGQRIHTGDLGESVMPCDHRHVIARYHKARPEDVRAAIAAAADGAADWANWRWEDRAAVFLRAAELLTTTRRDTLNAATMLGQAKTVFQSEIDAACELIDFWRFNAQFAQELYAEQPISDHTMWNQLDYRPLEGFVYAVTPFNFTAIGGNLCSAPALMGNVILWKPAATAMLSAWYVLQILEEAGLPPGVINFLPGDPVAISDIALTDPSLAGVHFTGSTGVFNSMWETIGRNMGRYRGYPRIVGETGGKDFIVAHPSADPQVLAVAMVRGAFEYQGQKCSAASRAYIPRSLWPEVRDRAVAMMEEMRMGDVRDFRNFTAAVIDEKAFNRNARYLAMARESATSSPAAARTARPAGTWRTRSWKRPIRRTRCCAKRSSARFSRATCTTTRSGRRRSRWWTARARTPSRAPSTRASAGCCSTPPPCCARRPAISTSTTSPPAPWWGSSRSAARAPRARTTRPAPSSTSCAG
jgi:delta-1-pyrroline-5-carboxylate dehydrogenase group 1